MIEALSFLSSENCFAGHGLSTTAPHSQAAEKVIHHLYKNERKSPTQVRRRLSRTQAFLGMVIPGGGCRCRG